MRITITDSNGRACEAISGLGTVPAPPGPGQRHYDAYEARVAAQVFTEVMGDRRQREHEARNETPRRVSTFL